MSASGLSSSGGSSARCERQTKRRRSNDKAARGLGRQKDSARGPYWQRHR